jgi:signal transduction histidine kinase
MNLTRESIVHDLRNPLSAVHGSAELLISSRLSELQVHRVAHNLYSASVRMKELLDELVSRSQGTDRGMECANIRDLVAGAVAKTARLAGSHAVHIVQYLPGDLTITLDRQRIERVFINLFFNAIEAMPSGGIIRISAVPLRQSVLITVRDTGPGIAPEIRDRLFEPFVTSGKANGQGLGLAFSRQAIVDHGGEMWVESSREGACFAFRLPRTDPTTLHPVRLMPLPREPVEFADCSESTP